MVYCVRCLGLKVWSLEFWLKIFSLELQICCYGFKSLNFGVWDFAFGVLDMRSDFEVWDIEFVHLSLGFLVWHLWFGNFGFGFSS